MVQVTSTSMVSPIPHMVDVSVSTASTDADGDENHVGKSKSPSPRLKEMNYGHACSTPGVMATATATATSQFPSPLGLFARGRRLFSDQSCSDNNLQNQDDSESLTNGSHATQSNRLGIARASYANGKANAIANKNDETSVSAVSIEASIASHRIGIVRPNYDDAPNLNLSPLDLYKKISSPTPNLVRSDDSESDGDSVWPPKLSSSTISRDSFVPDLKPSLEDTQEQETPRRLTDGVDRFVHQQTAQGHYLVNSQPLDSPIDGIKYCLTTGKKSMSPRVRKAASSSRATKTRPNIVSASSASKAAPVAVDEPLKVFLLLIQPQSKIFEIIQVFYSPSQTTVLNLIEMIPINATEPALGSQEYAGLCRHKDGIPISVNMMASSSSHDKNCAQIVRGEILVAIPKGYSGPLCARISSPILSNPKVRKLLERSDPLAPKRKKKKSSSSACRKTIEIETVAEETESPSSSSTYRDYEETLRLKQAQHEQKSKEWMHNERLAVRKALTTAAMEAASTNAQVERDVVRAAIRHDHDDGASADIPVEMWKTTMSLTSQYTRSSSFGESSIGSIDNNTAAESKSISSDMQNSYGSLDAEFLESLKRMPRRKNRPSRSVRRQNHRKLVRNVALALGMMLLRYLMVQSASAGGTAPLVPTEQYSVGHDTVFGLWGMVQVIVAFVGLVKFQRYIMQGKTAAVQQGGSISNFFPGSCRIKGD